MFSLLNTHLTRFHLIACCTIVLVVVRIDTTHTQTAPQQPWLEQIPSSFRARLVTRLHKYIEYERTREYEKLYELFSESTLKALRHKSKEAYAKARRDSSHTIVGFAPLSSGYDANAGVYVIGGEADIDESGRITNEIMHIYATLHNDDWYLSELFGSLANPGGMETLETREPLLTNTPHPKKPRIRKPRL